MDTACIDHVVRDSAVCCRFESWNEGTSMKNPKRTLSRIEAKGSVKVETRDCHDDVRNYTLPNNPQQNGVSERLKKMITVMTRCQQPDANLTKMFWV